MERDSRLAVKYKPVFMMDKMEPFEITAIGYTLFYETSQSDSFPKREIVIDKSSIKYAIEYAVWFDYDIQHLYELEHVWVYIGHDEAVCHVEGSFHGKYLTMVDLDTGVPVLEQETHPVVCLQPGKHAVLPDQRLVRLVPGWKECCMEQAGADGLLIQDMFRERIEDHPELQDMVRAYIRKQYAFIPSMEFQAFRPGEDLFMPWRELKSSIPDRINRQLEVIRQKKAKKSR
jgi:hypothetical protein